ncbi:MAG: SDR family oxidoreductase [Deltaproteobacteria bacterium]|nr:SDR family oxidoreductase [Deltaproteobacteria bacterium]
MEQVKGAVFVTGASTGIGRATALLLAKLGYPVFASVRQKKDADDLQRAASGNLTPVLMDVMDEDSIARAREQIAGALGSKGLWGLVNNAGISFRAPLEYTPLADFRRLYDANVFGLLAVTQAFLPLIRQSQGRIVNVSSLTSLWVTPFHGIYSSAKMAVNGISEALRMELLPHGVKVILMIYGGVQTALWDRVEKATADLACQYPPEFDTLYAARQRRAFEYFASAGRSGLLADQAAQPIVHALTSPKPKRIYLAGPGAKPARILSRLLPGPLKERFIMKSMGLDKL